MGTRIKDILFEIEKNRDILNKLAENINLLNAEEKMDLLRISQNMDELILKYHRESY